MILRLKKIYNYILRYKSIKTAKKIQYLGQNIELNYPLTIDKPENLFIEDYVYIGAESWISCYTKVHIKRGTIIGPRIKVYTGNHNYDSPVSIPYDDITFAKGVTIDENVWIGGDVIIMPGVHIGEGSVVAGGSVVTKSCPSCSIIGGNPARIIKTRDCENYYNLKAQDQIYLKMKKEGKLVPKTKVL